MLHRRSQACEKKHWALTSLFGDVAYIWQIDNACSLAPMCRLLQYRCYIRSFLLRDSCGDLKAIDLFKILIRSVMHLYSKFGKPPLNAVLLLCFWPMFIQAYQERKFFCLIFLKSQQLQVSGWIFVLVEEIGVTLELWVTMSCIQGTLRNKNLSLSQNMEKIFCITLWNVLYCLP